VEALIAARGRELEERTHQLATTIADLERREESARRLRIAVEEMLRRGSAELDERHAQLNALAAELAERDARLAASEEEVEERRRELGAVELRRAAVERREESAAERDAAVEQGAAELAERRRELETVAAEIETRLVRALELEQAVTAEREALEAQKAALAEAVADLEMRVRSLAAAQASLAERQIRVGDLEERAAELERRAADVDRREQRLANHTEALEAERAELAPATATVAMSPGVTTEETPHPSAAATHLRLVPGDRYHLDEAAGPPPSPGSTVDVQGAPHRVLRLGPSPFPGDPRRCAYLELDETP
jgi:chromosome segregation ATPase